MSSVESSESESFVRFLHLILDLAPVQTELPVTTHLDPIARAYHIRDIK